MLINNSIHHRNACSAFIHVVVTVSDHKAIIKVSDNGRGIEKEHRQMFYLAIQMYLIVLVIFFGT